MLSSYSIFIRRSCSYCSCIILCLQCYSYLIEGDKGEIEAGSEGDEGEAGLAEGAGQLVSTQACNKESHKCIQRLEKLRQQYFEDCLDACRENVC
jgi:hypothetical protein